MRARDASIQRRVAAAALIQGARTVPLHELCCALPGRGVYDLKAPYLFAMLALALGRAHDQSAGRGNLGAAVAQQSAQQGAANIWGKGRGAMS